MTTRVHPIAEINQRAKDALIREVGVIDTIRFLNQFRAGDGDYAADRASLFRDMTAREIIAEIKSRRVES